MQMTLYYCILPSMPLFLKYISELDLHFYIEEGAEFFLGYIKRVLKRKQKLVLVCTFWKREWKKSNPLEIESRTADHLPNQ